MWTLDEIKALGDFDTEHGWFYGFAWIEGRFYFGEIFPGYGVAASWVHPWWSLRQWRQALRDVFNFRPE